MKRAALFMLYQTFLYSTLVFNFRAVAQARYGWAIVSDTLIAAVGFIAVKEIAKSKSKLDWVGFVIGGAAGSALGIWISIRTLGM